MPKKIDGYFITDEAKRRFRIWLLDNKLSMNKFAKKAGASRQYFEQVLNRKIKVTPNVIEWFKKGGYELL